MARACHVAVRMAVGDVFSDADIDDMLNRMESRARRKRLETPTQSQRQALAEAAGEMTKEAIKAAFEQRRMRIAAEIARDQVRRPKLDPLVEKLGPAKALEALNVGLERQLPGASSSVDAEGRARQMSLWGQVERGLNAMPGLKDRLSNFWGVGERGFDRKVATEMARLNGGEGIEPTGDEGALHAARALVAGLQAARQMQNDVGAWIDEIPGYIGRQSHDPGKVAGGYWRELGEVARRVKAGDLAGAFDWNAASDAAVRRAFGAWRDAITPGLDERTFAGLEPEDLERAAPPPKGAKGEILEKRNADLAKSGILKDPTDVRELMLYRVWSDIVTGRHAQITGASDLGDFRPQGSMARSVSQARVLHFKSPDAWMDYAEQYGRGGGLYSAVLGQLERAGRNAALMKVWGPSPADAFAAEVDRLRAETTDTRQVGALDNPMVRARFEAVNGMADAPANLRLAQFMNGARQWEALTKLGAITLSKATDLPITASTFKRVGGTWLGGYKAAFFDGILHLAPAEQKLAADALDVGARSFAGHVGGQFLASDGPKGWLGWGVKTLYKLNFFEAMNNSIRHGAAGSYAALLGREAEHDFAGLQPGTAETLERFGITAKDWDAARAGLTPASDGRKYFTLDRDLDPDVRLKFATMIHNVLDDTVSEPRARERSGMTRGTRAGTAMGELDRSFFQFKGFVNTIVGRHLVPAARGYAGVAPAFTLAHIILGTALAGYVSMNAKALARGELPRAPIGATPWDTAKIWLASMEQGGGLGLYGDFLFGEMDRSGHDFDWGELGGPIISDSQAVAKMVQQSVAGGEVNETTGRSPLPGEAVKFASQNIPLINLWYTRAALDYGLLWRMQEAVSPGYLQRYEANSARSRHAEYWLHPSSAAN